MKEFVGKEFVDMARAVVDEYDTALDIEMLRHKSLKKAIDIVRQAIAQYDEDQKHESATESVARWHMENIEGRVYKPEEVVFGDVFTVGEYHGFVIDEGFDRCPVDLNKAKVEAFIQRPGEEIETRRALFVNDGTDGKLALLMDHLGEWIVQFRIKHRGLMWHTPPLTFNVLPRKTSRNPKAWSPGDE